MALPVVIALVLAGGVGPNVQAQQQFQPPAFSKQTYKIKDENWVEYTIQVKYVSTETMGAVACTNPCKGKKHTLHAECDTSCDGACTEIHKYEFVPRVGCRPGGDLKLGAEKMGLPDVTWPVVDAVGKKLVDLVKGTEKKHDLKHWNTSPCSESHRLQKREVFQVSATYQFFRNDPGPNGTKILVKGPSGVWDFGPLDIPVGDLTEPTVAVRCKCSVVEGDGQGGGIWIQKDDKTYLATSKIIEDMGISVECESMFSSTISCTNTTTEPCTVIVGAGTVFASEDAGVQNETCCERVSFECPGLSTVSFPVKTTAGERSVWDWFSTSAKARAACLNMTKHEPSSGDKFKIEQPSDNAVVRLAQFVDRERFRGPWDQIRFWILTDKASRDEMAKILLPKPTPGMYLRCLYEVSQTTGTDLTGPEFNKCFEPGLAIGASASQEATNWYVQAWTTKGPKTLANWLVKNTGLLTEECFGPDTGKVEAQHAADLFNALCATRDPDLVEAAVTCLIKAVPEGKRQMVAEAHGLSGVMGLLMERDEKAASRALDVADVYRDPLSKPGLLNTNDSHIEVIKERADKIYREMTSAFRGH